MSIERPQGMPGDLPWMAVQLVRTPDRRMAVSWGSQGLHPSDAVHALRTLADDIERKYVELPFPETAPAGVG